jgi:hypothetical protein
MQSHLAEAGRPTLFRSVFAFFCRDLWNALAGVPRICSGERFFSKDYIQILNK